MWNNWLVVIFLGFCFLQVSCSEFEGGTFKPMQEDFDKTRLEHILIISSLVNEYEDKVGYFPFANRSENPISVTIASEDQIKNDQGRAQIFLDLSTRTNDGVVPEQPKSIEKISLQEFTTELEKVLQKSITLPIDPQKVPLNKPSLYQYTYYLGVFDVTAFLHNKFSFTRTLNQFNNKISVGNRSNHHSAIWTPQELIIQEDFNQFFQSPFNEGKTQMSLGEIIWNIIQIIMGVYIVLVCLKIWPFNKENILVKEIPTLRWLFVICGVLVISQNLYVLFNSYLIN
jgi:hypothetical protein